MTGKLIRIIFRF